MFVVLKRDDTKETNPGSALGSSGLVIGNAGASATLGHRRSGGRMGGRSGGRESVARTKLRLLTDCRIGRMDVHNEVQFSQKPPAGIVVLSKTAEYALRAVACMGTQADRPVSADHLAHQTKVPRRYLTRVLQDLAASGLVQSRPGPGGGYELCKPTTQITILDVVNTVDPIQRIRSCPLGLKTHTALCPLHAELDRAYAATELAFAGVTVADLVESSSPIIPLCEQ